MERQESYPITKEAYDYVLPVPGMRKHLLHRVTDYGDEYAFIGTQSEWEDMQCRCELLEAASAPGM